LILLDKRIFKGIFEITTDILKNNFYYDFETLADFHELFTKTIASQYCVFEDNSDDEFKRWLRFDLRSRQLFTSYFISYHLHEILVKNLHFSEKELDLFENILPKFVGVYDVKQQGNQRTNH
jgi:hypothetical protein